MQARIGTLMVGLVALGCGPSGGAEGGADSSSSDATTTMTSTVTSTMMPTTTSTMPTTITGVDSDGTSTTTTEDSTGTSEGSSDSTGIEPVEPGEVQALPPVRIREVCEALDGGGASRCCMRSMCGMDYADTVTCFTDAVQDAVITAGDEDLLDVLLVVDNTVDMGPPQRELALRVPQLITSLRGLQTSGAADLDPDVNVFVTTTDFGNPLCTPFQAHPPEMGAPISTACTDRLDRFTSLTGAQVYEQACTDACVNPTAPTGGDPFINFGVGGDNVAMVPPHDVDGDGADDDSLTQALACLLPQGLDGCGYEQPLENMLQALNPGASWNGGPAPFLRPNATLAIVIMTNELDCSVQDYSIMADQTLQNVDPDTGMTQASSAICWNTGVQCNGPDAEGIYDACTPTVGGGLHSTSRYTNYLVNELRDNQGKEVVMLVIGGSSLEGVEQTVVHDWRDEDINAADMAAGVTAADKQFNFGIGPGCGGMFP